MWWRKRKPATEPVDWAVLQCDVHSHLIPGIDDGVQSMGEAVALLARFEAMGFQHIVTTPHIHPQYRNTAADILARLEPLQAAAAEAGLRVQVQAAAEYFLDEHFLALLQRDELLHFGARYVLFETSHMHQPVGVERVVAQLRAAGYQPLLAHPERYRWAWNDRGLLQAIREAGALFQMNTNSLSGAYGAPVQQTAAWLAEQGMVQFLGSDAHGGHHLDRLQLAAVHPAVRALVDSRTLLNPTLLRSGA